MRIIEIFGGAAVFTFFIFALWLMIVVACALDDVCAQTYGMLR